MKSREQQESYRANFVVEALILLGLLAAACGSPMQASEEVYQARHDSIGTALVEQATKPELYVDAFHGCESSAVGIKIKNFNPELNADVIFFGSGSAVMEVDSLDETSGVYFTRFYLLTASHLYQDSVVPPYDVYVDGLEIVTAPDLSSAFTNTTLNLEHALPLMGIDGQSHMSLLVANNRGLNGAEPPYISYSGTWQLKGWQETGGVMRFRAFPGFGDNQVMVVGETYNAPTEVGDTSNLGRIHFFDNFLGPIIASNGASGSVGCTDLEYDGVDEMVAMVMGMHITEADLSGMTVFPPDIRLQVEKWITQVSGVNFGN